MLSPVYIQYINKYVRASVCVIHCNLIKHLARKFVAVMFFFV